MNLCLVGSAVAGLGAALGHAYLGERLVLRPMFKARGDNRVLSVEATRRVIRWVWHLPSIAWAQVAAVTIWFVLLAPPLYAGPTTGAGFAALTWLGVGIYLSGALANLWAMRKPHVGNILLTVAAAGLALGSL